MQVIYIACNLSISASTQEHALVCTLNTSTNTLYRLKYSIYVYLFNKGTVLFQQRCKVGFRNGSHRFSYQSQLLCITVLNCSVKYIPIMECKKSSPNSISIRYAILITLAFFSRFILDKLKCQTETIQVYWWWFYMQSEKVHEVNYGQWRNQTKYDGRAQHNPMHTF